MKPQRPFLLGVWVLTFVTIFRLFIFGVLYYSLTHATFPRGRNASVSFYIYFLIFLPVIEAYIYWLLRYSIQKKSWVHLHVWSLFVALVMLPLVMFFIMPFALNYSSVSYLQVWMIQRYVFLGLIILGHIFFIATIVRNLINKNELKGDETSSGLLDEFIN